MNARAFRRTEPLVVMTGERVRMFTLPKVRDQLVSYEDPGWCQQPKSSTARAATLAELTRRPHPHDVQRAPGWGRAEGDESTSELGRYVNLAKFCLHDVECLGTG